MSAATGRLLEAGLAALDDRDLERASGLLVEAVRASPASPHAWLALARLYRTTGQFDDALAAAGRALALDAGSATALVAVGDIQRDLGRWGDAESAYARAIDAGDDALDTALLHASAAIGGGRAGAVAAALDELAARHRDAADVHFVRGNALSALGRDLDAAGAFARAIAQAPDWAEAHANRGSALAEARRWRDAADAFARALALKAELPGALSQLVFLKRRLCDWDGLDALAARLHRAAERGAPGIMPFALLAEPAAPALQLAVARSWATQQAAAAPKPSPRPIGSAGARDGRPRVAFISSGFNNHPTALLTVALIEALKGGEVETLGVATAPSDGGPLRARIAAAFDRFETLLPPDFAAMAARLDALAPDVAIDLRGYGGGAVTPLFARRIAPVQINWLAYPGTSGAAFIDYLIADRVVIPQSARPHYSERVIELDRAFQPSDPTRPVGTPPSRGALGLPDQGVVFASFNNSYKITPEVFADWMAILGAVPEAVLWLLAPDAPEVLESLRRAAGRAGIDPARLRFQPKLPHLDYLALYRHVDLFLDTRPYNAHTTASDALWAGVPLLTFPGETFASRVAASLLTTLGCGDFIVDSAARYRERAIEIGGDPTLRAATRARFEAARTSSPLFDIAGFARRFERAMLAVVARQRAGREPVDFAI